MTKPLPCPFCKSGALYADRSPVDIDARWQVICQGCGATGPLAKTKREAIAKWNAAPREGDAK